MAVALVLGAGPSALPAGLGAALQQTVSVDNRVPGWLGVNLDVISTVEDGQTVASRMSVVDVHEGTGAFRAGLLRGDLILRVNGEDATLEVLTRTTGALKAGDPVALEVQRDGRRLAVAITASPRPETLPGPAATVASGPAMRRVVVFSPRSARQASWSALRDSRTSDVTGRPGEQEARSVRVRTSEGNAVTIVFQSSDSEGTSSFSYSLADPRTIRTYMLHTPEVEALISGIDAMRLELNDMVEWQERTPQDGPTTLWRIFGGRLVRPPSPESEVVIERLQSRIREMERELASRAVERIGPVSDSVLTVTIADKRPITPYAYLGRRYLAGAFLVALNPGMQEYFGVSQGALVLDAVEGAPAQEAGLMPGDVIVAIDGRLVPDPDGLQLALADARPPYALTVVRQGNRIEVVLP